VPSALVPDASADTGPADEVDPPVAEHAARQPLAVNAAATTRDPIARPEPLTRPTVVPVAPGSPTGACVASP
jgi:hypothetical protein